ncbi:MAG: hypothetical protein AAF416_12775 [Pseudomonadota bacterium]
MTNRLSGAALVLSLALPASASGGIIDICPFPGPGGCGLPFPEPEIQEAPLVPGEVTVVETAVPLGPILIDPIGPTGPTGPLGPKKGPMNGPMNGSGDYYGPGPIGPLPPFSSDVVYSVANGTDQEIVWIIISGGLPGTVILPPFDGPVQDVNSVFIDDGGPGGFPFPFPFPLGPEAIANRDGWFGTTITPEEWDANGGFDFFPDDFVFVTDDSPSDGPQNLLIGEPEPLFTTGSGGLGTFESLFGDDSLASVFFQLFPSNNIASGEVSTAEFILGGGIPLSAFVAGLTDDTVITGEVLNEVNAVPLPPAALLLLGGLAGLVSLRRRA